MNEHILIRLVNASYNSAKTYREFLDSLSSDELEMLDRLGNHVADIAKREKKKRSNNAL